MQIGYLRVEVSSANRALPTVAARVTVTYCDKAEETVFTDSSGHTETFEQLAPDRELSLDPDFNGEVYSTMDVEVRAFKFKTTIVRGVQIFAGETSILPVDMQPAEIGPDNVDNEPIVIEIPPNIVNEREHTAEPPPPGLQAIGRVLPAVVIPENITVHLGRPTVAAANVTVRFQDYIKNVACSELYVTWPENSLRANIYCQISITLNRVFTEWYRSRGFNFDITNSTSFDQYYVHGRSIALNISRIVDEIFNIYIRRTNHVEPLFAEYCNGTTATCPGLKQWGTVTLANQGYTPLGILRYYFGNNINLHETFVVKGVPQSYPGTPLRLGNTGDAVTTFQTWLARIRRNYPRIPAVTVDGVFGVSTQAAVREFQSIFNLVVDGIVGRATWYRMSYIFVSVTKLAELGSEGIIAPPPVPPLPSNVLRLGSTGDLVSLAQYMLNLIAAFYSQLQPIPIDGVYGLVTQAAVREFQRFAGIGADGIIGPVTWDRLYDFYYSAFNALNPVNPPFPGTSLRVGSRGTNVSLIQRNLNFIGRFFGSIRPVLIIDGLFGVNTQAAVTAFQRQFGLTPDGVVGPATWTTIIRVYDTLAASSALAAEIEI